MSLLSGLPGSIGDADDLTEDGELRCECINTVEDHCSHMGRCEEPVEGCGGSVVFCESCLLNALANEG